MDKLRSTFVALWEKIKSLSPLVPLMLASLLLALLLGGGNDLVGALSLFQSPPPPPPREEPTATPPPPTATPVPTETPVPPPEPTATPVPTEAMEEPTVEPTEEPMPEPTEEPTVEPTEEPTVEPTEEPTPELTEELDEEEEAPPLEESSPLIFNWGVFLNTVIVTLSYAWIFCGVCGLVGTPLAFILLYVGGKRRLRQRREESGETEQTPEADQTGK